MKRVASNLFVRKPVETLIAEMESGHRLQRVLGPIALISLGVGATIGAGVFVLSGQVAHDYAGPSITVSFIVAGLACALAALCYAELASMVPVAGSAYTYAYATLGEFPAWIIGWDLIIEYAIGSAAVAVGWSNYLVEFLQGVLGIKLDPRLLSSPWDYDVSKGEFVWKTVKFAGADGSVQEVVAWLNLPAALIVLGLTGILVLGIKESARFNAAMVLTNIAIILTVIFVGSWFVKAENWTPFLHEEKGWRGIAEGAGKIFFAYIGFDSISTHAEEARNPRRDLAIGLLGSLVICTVLYVAVTAVLTGMSSYRDIDVNAPFAVAFRGRGMPITASLIAFGILAGTTSSLLVGLLSQPRILLAMARDGMLPMSFFGAVHPRFLTPWKSTILIGVLMALLSAVAPLSLLADLVSVGTLFAFMIVCASVWILRVRNPDIDRPFRVPGLPLIAASGILVNGGLMYYLGRDNWVRLLVWLAIGMVIYFGYGRYHSKFSRPAPSEH
ncbi:MAG: amino acid permease [Isosphaeraceae bacterium]|nr:amino acid permease [Isosphaeraceae bacterium]